MSSDDACLDGQCINVQRADQRAWGIVRAGVRAERQKRGNSDDAARLLHPELAEDVPAARDWYAEFLGLDADFGRPDPDGRTAYVEFRVGDSLDVLGIMTNPHCLEILAAAGRS